MKKINGLVAFILFSLSFQAKSDVLLDFKKEMESKIQLGMSTAEVKTALGPPKALQSGFPKSNETIIKELPEMVGQLAQSTWFYFYEPINQVIFVPAGIAYQINGISTTKELFEQYKNSAMVYLLKNEILDFDMVRGYRITKNRDLDSAKVDKEKTFAKEHGKMTVTKRFLPIFCVIFEKGTLSVAGTKTFFKFIDEKTEDGY